MPRCEQCNREFATEEGLKQHNMDKHGIGRITSHEMKEQKKQQKEAEREKARSQLSQKKMLKYGAYAVVALLILAGAWYVAQSLPPTQAGGTYDLAGFPNSFVHWHADVEVLVCGEKRTLPEAAPGGLIGTLRMHTHDYAQNIASLPGTDGNGVIHTEGIIPSAPAEHTLAKFMSNIGIRFSETEIMDKKNGDACGSETGSVKVFLNDEPLENFLNYLPRNGDLIRIEFSA